MGESQLLSILRRLHRRLLHHRRVNGDPCLGAKIQRTFTWLGEIFPQVLPLVEDYGDEAITVTEALISAGVCQQKTQALRKWESDVAGDVRAQRAEIKRRARTA